MVAALSGQRGCGHCPHLNLPYCACLRPLELPSLGLHLLMHVCGHSDMTWIRKRSARAGSFRGESSAVTIGRVPSSGSWPCHRGAPRNRPGRGPDADDRSRWCLRNTAAHADVGRARGADQSADKPPSVKLCASEGVGGSGRAFDHDRAVLWEIVGKSLRRQKKRS